MEKYYGDYKEGKYLIDIKKKREKEWLFSNVKDAVSNMISTKTQRLDERIKIGDQIKYSIFQGLFIGVGIEIIAQIFNDEKISIKAIFLKGISAGFDFGVKTSSAHILKSAVRNGYIEMIPQMTPISTLANLSYIVVEDIKVIARMTSSNNDGNKILKELERVTIITIMAILVSNEGVKLGICAGYKFGSLVGNVIGFLCGVIGYTIGYKLSCIILNILEDLKSNERQMRMRIVNKFICLIKKIVKNI